ncbi:MAG: hypothetical protein QXV69_09370 [Sulfolobaceae archaeon]
MGKLINDNGKFCCIKYDYVCNKGVDAICFDKTQKHITRPHIYAVEIKETRSRKTMLEAIRNVKNALENTKLDIGHVLIVFLQDQENEEFEQYKVVKEEIEKKFKVKVSTVSLDQEKDIPLSYKQVIRTALPLE